MQYVHQAFPVRHTNLHDFGRSQRRLCALIAKLIEMIQWPRDRGKLDIVEVNIKRRFMPGLADDNTSAARKRFIREGRSLGREVWVNLHKYHVGTGEFAIQYVRQISEVAAKRINFALKRTRVCGIRGQEIIHTRRSIYLFNRWLLFNENNCFQRETSVIEKPAVAERRNWWKTRRSVSAAE